MKRLSILVVVAAFVGSFTVPVHGQSALIQAALQNFVRIAHTWTATQTFTNVAVTSAVLYPDGTVSLPSIAFTGQPALGLFRSAANTIAFTDGLGSVGGVWLTGSGFGITSTRAYNWGAGSDPTSIDTQLTRAAAGVVNVTAGFRAAFYTSPASTVLSITSNVIAPTGSVHHVGAGLIKTITVPAACANTCSVDIVPDAAFTTDITGNISLASTAVTTRTLRFTWDGTKWNPSY